MVNSLVWSVRLWTTLALKAIIKTKSKFVNFANNLLVTIKNAFIKTRFYIINTFSFKLILSFLFIRKTKLTFRYFKNIVDKLVFVCIRNLKTGYITTVKTNTETKSAKNAVMR
jgi:hypothetical protein